jgi:ATP-dependent RNA helicase SUPV3L1/SUV3
LAKWVEGLVGRELGAIAAVEAKAEADGTLRGPAFLLREQLGIAPGATEREIPPEVRQKLKGIGVRAGRFALFVPEALKPRAMALRAQIWALIRDIPVPTLPPPGLIALPMRPVPDGEVPPPHMLWPSGFAEAMGWLPAGPVLLRLDVAERIAAELGFLTRRAPAPPPPDLASRLGVKGDMLGTALTALGFRILDPVPWKKGSTARPPRSAWPSPGPSRPPRREGRGAAPAQHRQGARPDRNRRPPQPGEAQAPRNGGAEFYGPPVPPELRAARPPPPGARSATPAATTATAAGRPARRRRQAAAPPRRGQAVAGRRGPTRRRASRRWRHAAPTGRPSAAARRPSRPKSESIRTRPSPSSPT